MPCPLPPCGVGPVVVLVGPASPVGRCVPWLLPLVSSNVVVTCSLPYQNMMLLFSPCKRCPCPCSDAVLRSCEEALAGIILHRPPSLWFAWVRSGCAGPLGAGRAGAGGRGPGGGDPRAYRMRDFTLDERGLGRGSSP